MNPNGSRPKIVIDTDFGFMNDDCTASLMALQAPSLDVLGLTIVAGNFDLQQEVENALCTLDRAGLTAVPVCAGCDRPLIHRRGTYEASVWGQWATHGPVRSPFGRPAGLHADDRHAVDFIIEQVRRFPGEVVLVALGPLTNLALAIRKAPDIAASVREIVISGGAIAGLPRGEGNLTPLAEFNIWVDPEAAHIVLTSGAPILLCPLNASRPVRFEAPTVERLLAVDTPVTRLFRDAIAPAFSDPALEAERAVIEVYGFCDHVAVGAAMSRSQVRTVEMQVVVDLTPGIGYGITHGYVLAPPASDSFTHHPWVWNGVYQRHHPTQEGVAPPAIEVATDVDAQALIDLFVETITGLRVEPAS